MASRPRLWIFLLLIASVVLGAPAFADEPRAIPGELLIKFKQTARAADRNSLMERMGATSIKRWDFIGVDHVKLPEGKSVDEAIAEFTTDPAIEYVEPNWEIKLDAIPNDPQFPQLWGMRNTGQTGGTPGADIRATNAWDVFTGNPNTLVGVIDTGVDYTHADLAANAWTNAVEAAGLPGVDDDGNGYVDDIHGYDFVNNDGDPMDDNDHGTHVSGTIGGVGNNGIGVAGVNWNIKIAGIKFLSAGGTGSTDDAISGVQYAIAIGCQLTSNSWGGGGFSQALLDAINAAGASGQLFIAAAGNSRANNDVSPHYPSSYDTPYIIAVGATNHNDTIADEPTWGSNYGATSVDIGAPGVNIVSTIPGNGYASFSGTSMATPHVSGVAALAFGRFPGITNMQVKNLIMTFADPIPALAGRWVTGGRLNAFMVIADPDETPPGQVDDLAVADQGSNHIGLSWTATGDDGEVGTASNYDIRYSTAPIDAGNFDLANPAGGPDPAASGTPETFEVGGLVSSTLYYFAIKALDEYGNPGPISNVVFGTTLGAPAIATNPTSFEETLIPGASVSRTLTISNTAAGNLDFTIPVPEFILGAAAAPKPYLPLGKGEVDPRPAEPALDASGGPDAFGYRWIDSNSPGGPVFSWVDITGVGTPIALNADDQNLGPFPLPFPFEFYGTTFNSFRVASNGFLTFTGTGAPFTNQPLPNTGGEPNMICPFWDDMDFRNFGDAYYYYDGVRFIVSWIEVPPYSTTPTTPPPDRYTFQILLYPSGEIRYQYQSMTPPSNSATVGIQNASETIGLQVAFNAAYVQDGLAVKIQPLVEWMHVSPSSGRVLAGQSQDVQVDFDATGLEGGDYHAIVHVLSNDPVNNHLQLPATLHVPGGVSDINVNPTALDFGTFFVGGSPTRQFLVSNAGSTDLHVTDIVSDDPSLTVDVSAFTLAGGNSQNVTATWAPGSAYALNATLTIQSDDPDETSVVVTAVGNAVVAPDVSVTPAAIQSALATTLGPTALTETKELVIHNDGASDLTWSASATINGITSTAVNTDEVTDKDVQDGPPGPPVTDASGGPDAAGYRWVDSNEPGGPVFSWIDITGIGTPIAFTGDDQNLGPIALPFPFTFYGTTFNSIRACSNGWLSFTATATTFTNTALPNTGTGAPKNLIAPFWDDQDFTTGGDAYYYYDGSKFIISYVNVPHYAPGGAGTYTYQVLLYPSGQIDYQYLSVAGLVNSNTIGIQNADGTIGLQVVFNAAYVANNLRVSIRQRPEWFTIAPASGTTPAGQTSIVTVSLDATDLEDGDYTGNINVSSNDPDEGSVNVPVGLHVGVATASMDIDPNAVSSIDTHQWINALITPPGGFDEHDILGSSLLIDATVPADPAAPVSYQPGVAIHGFSRMALLAHLEEGRAIPIQLMGEVADQTWFTANDVIRVLKPVLLAGIVGPYDVGTDVPLAWQDPSGTTPTHYDIWYSSDGGDTWMLVAGGLTDRSYTWRVPNPSTEEGVLEVAAYDGEGYLGSAFTDKFHVIGSVTGIDDGSVPDRFGLRFASAVPSRGDTRLELAVPRAGDVSVAVIDLRGALVQQVAKGAFEPGRHTLRWNGTDESGRPARPGVYFVQATYGGQTSNLRFAIIR